MWMEPGALCPRNRALDKVDTCVCGGSLLKPPTHTHTHTHTHRIFFFFLNKTNQQEQKAQPYLIIQIDWSIFPGVTSNFLPFDNMIIIPTYPGG